MGLGAATATTPTPPTPLYLPALRNEALGLCAVLLAGPTVVPNVATALRLAAQVQRANEDSRPARVTQLLAAVSRHHAASERVEKVVVTGGGRCVRLMHGLFPGLSVGSD
jgi:hypothetical protein